MKVGKLVEMLLNMDPNAEIKVASAAEGDPLVEDLVIAKAGFNVVLLQTQSFMLELERRAYEAGTGESDKPKLKLVN